MKKTKQTFHKKTSKTLLIVVNVDWILISHRLKIAEKAVQKGYRVVVATKDSGKAHEIIDKGIEFIPLNITRSGTNPLRELVLLFDLFFLYAKVKPDLIFHLTLKPLIYGSLAAKLLRRRTINAVSGLGYNFTENRRGFVQKMMLLLMRFGLSKDKNHLIFQNHDDFKELSRLNIIHQNTTVHFIKGVGVDLNVYKATPKNNEVISIIMPSRMLWDKGVNEFFEAAALLKKKYYGKVSFSLLGKIDKENKMGVLTSYLTSIEDKGFIEWKGNQDNMVEHYKNADIVVLPSYREGMPRTLIEACAAGLPIVTTNAIGCRDCVEEGKNGYKVPVKSVKELAAAMEKLILSKEDRIRMGRYSRKKAEREFDQKEVVAKHMEIFQQLLRD